MKSSTSTQTLSTSPLTNSDIHWIILGLFLLGLFVIMQPVILALLHKNFKSTIQTPSGEEKIDSFFQIPYITYFLSHYGISSLALIAITALGIDHVLGTSTIAALLGSLLGYMLGSSTASHATALATKQSPKEKDKK